MAGLTADGRVRLTGEVSGYEEAARWSDVTQLFLDGDTLLGLTGDGHVLAAAPELAFDPSELHDMVNILTGGGPAGSTTTITQYLYTFGIKNLNFGFGSAGALIMTIIVMILAIPYIKNAISNH